MVKGTITIAQGTRFQRAIASVYCLLGIIILSLVSLFWLIFIVAHVMRHLAIVCCLDADFLLQRIELIEVLSVFGFLASSLASTCYCFSTIVLPFVDGLQNI